VRDVAAAMGSVSWTRCHHGGGWCGPVHVTPCSGSLPTTYAAFGYGSTPYCVGAKPFVSVGYMAPRPNPPRPPLPRRGRASRRTTAVGICPWINHMKLHKHTQRLIYRQACVSHALNFSSLLLFSYPYNTCYNSYTRQDPVLRWTLKPT
jgi:hypothetical protein